MPKTLMFRNTCSIACGWMSLPGVPKGIWTLPSLSTMAGEGVNRGRLPGATEAGRSGSHHDCEPREDGHRPVPGITGVADEPSLGVAENALPSRSIAHTYEVSASGAGSPRAAFGSLCTLAPPVSPAGGISGHAWSRG